jgi:hypothetical protein
MVARCPRRTQESLQHGMRAAEGHSGGTGEGRRLDRERTGSRNEVGKVLAQG